MHTPSHAHAHPLTSTCTPLTYICHHPLTYTCTPLTYICHPPPPHIHMHTPHIHMPPTTPSHTHAHAHAHAHPSHIYSYTHARIHTHKQNAPFVFFSSFFSLSLIDSSLTYQNVTAALRTLTDWHSLGVRLGVEKSRLDAIKIDYAQWGVMRQRDEVINVWLCSDTQASWSKLSRALVDMELNVLAEEIQSQ